MSYTLRYTSKRREVWAWYWRSWRSGLWRFHLTIFAWVVAIALKFGQAPLTAENLTIAAAMGFLCVAWMPLVPMIMFKSQERTLEIGDERVSTSSARKPENGAGRKFPPLRSATDTF